MAIIYGLKVNLSVAMVAMLNHTHLHNEHTAAQALLPVNTTAAPPVVESACNFTQSTGSEEAQV